MKQKVQVHLLVSAEKVQLTGADSQRLDEGSDHVELGVEPNAKQVFRYHQHIHPIRVHALDWNHPDQSENGKLAQIAFALGGRPLRVRIARSEQQFLSDHVLLGLPMKEVDQLGPGILRADDVFGSDQDLAYPLALRLRIAFSVVQIQRPFLQASFVIRGLFG